MVRLPCRVAEEVGSQQSSESYIFQSTLGIGLDAKLKIASHDKSATVFVNFPAARELSA